MSKRVRNTRAKPSGYMRAGHLPGRPGRNRRSGGRVPTIIDDAPTHSELRDIQYRAEMHGQNEILELARGYKSRRESWAPLRALMIKKNFAPGYRRGVFA